MRKLVEYTFTKDYGKYKKGDTIECHPSTKKVFEQRLKVEDEKPKRVRRTKEQIESDKKD